MSAVKPKYCTARSGKDRCAEAKRRRKDCMKLQEIVYVRSAQRDPLIFQKIEKVCLEVLRYRGELSEGEKTKIMKSAVSDKDKNIPSVVSAPSRCRKGSFKSRLIAKLKKLCVWR
ncbi:hypothetical protein GWI33_002686 [Rhynchophorus ferrugineus]|uniref:Uncharacterized protein n=1 Tax=Rhynchophorus ferrugineus TaxID=354439 RepID=A0A834HJJ0_RHYFE|nr:hypothetical protein GWI33_002686 [Rhynchophorus ferrugineus]